MIVDWLFRGGVAADVLTVQTVDGRDNVETSHSNVRASVPGRRPLLYVDVDVVFRQQPHLLTRLATVGAQSTLEEEGEERPVGRRPRAPTFRLAAAAMDGTNANASQRQAPAGGAAALQLELAVEWQHAHEFHRALLQSRLLLLRAHARRLAGGVGRSGCCGAEQ